MIKIGLIGGKQLLRSHIEHLIGMRLAKVVGFYEPDDFIARELLRSFPVIRFDSPDELIKAVDALVILQSPHNGYEVTSKALRASKHVLVHSLIEQELSDAKGLIRLSHEADVKFQLSNPQRFNATYQEAQKSVHKPLFIQCEHLGQFNRSTLKRSVIYDMMFHDIELILSVVKSNVQKVHANGVSVLTDALDIVNARIEFDNGCVANLTASRVSMDNRHKTCFFQRDAFHSVDFDQNVLEVVRTDLLTKTMSKGWEFVDINQQNPDSRSRICSIDPSNALKEELQSFINNIALDSTPEVEIYNGYNALDTAFQIEEKINLNTTV